MEVRKMIQNFIRRYRGQELEPLPDPVHVAVIRRLEEQEKRLKMLDLQLPKRQH